MGSDVQRGATRDNFLDKLHLQIYTTLHLRIRHCISGYDIASPGTTLHLRIRHCISGYDIASLDTTLHLRVRHYISGYDIASPDTTLHLRIRHCISGYDISHLRIRYIESPDTQVASPGTTLSNTGYDIKYTKSMHNSTRCITILSITAPLHNTYCCLRFWREFR